MASMAQIVTDTPSDTPTPTDTPTMAKAKDLAQPALYLIRHVNFGSDDGSPSSKFEIDFSCDDYAQARAIFDLVVGHTKYKPSKLILSHKHTTHLSHVSVPYKSDLPSLGGFPASTSAQSALGGVLISGLKDQSVTVHRGRTSGFKGTATGYGYLAPIPASAKRVFLFHKDKTGIGPDTAIKSELILEVLIGPESKWYSAKYVKIPHLGTPQIITTLLAGIIETLKNYVVKCPYCISKDCFVEKLVREIDVESRCARCHRSFFITLFE